MAHNLSENLKPTPKSEHAEVLLVLQAELCHLQTTGVHFKNTVPTFPRRGRNGCGLFVGLWVLIIAQRVWLQIVPGYVMIKSWHLVLVNADQFKCKALADD